MKGMGMSRIEKTFENLRSKGEKALIPYIMAGDPDLEKTKQLVLALDRSGADIIELGVPFSDPIADGPVIQRAGQRALKNRTSLRDVVQLVGSLRRTTEVPLVLMSYANPILAYGEEPFFRDAASAGVDGLIVPDLPPEEGASMMALAQRHTLDLILLSAPTSSRKRLKTIAGLTRGFVYYVSMTGITGSEIRGLQEIKTRVSEIRMLTKKPVAVGFGVSTPDQAAYLSQAADGVIVGSAIVKVIETNLENQNLLGEVSHFVKSLKQAITPARRALSKYPAERVRA
jgi:tryptophan synthase alpha chain